MAYAVKYVFTFQSVGGTTREIRILKDGYSGDPIRRALGRAPILKKQQNGPVHGTSLEMYAECHVDQEFIEFYTSDPKEYRVDLYAGNALLWQGWITPELYSEPDIAPPYDVQVIATDGVGELKLYDFAAQGMVSLRAMLTYLLGKTGLSTDVFLVSSLKAGSASAGALLDMEANFDYLVGKTCYEALSYLLTTLHATITWWGGHWLLVRENNVTFTSGKVRYFNTAGNSALLANSVQELGSMYQDPAWPVGQLSTVIDPAKNKIVVQAPWHPVTALKNSDMTQDSNWSKIQVSYDSTKGAYWFPQNAITTGELYQAVVFGGLRVPMRMTLSGCGSSEAGSGFFGQGNGWLGLVLRYVDGSNNVYYLGTDGDGNRRWEQATPGQTPVRAFKQDLLSVDVDRENADRIELDIPALAVGGTFPAGTLTVSIYGGAAYLFSAQLDVILNKGYQDILHIDNGARGEGDDTEVAIGRVTSDIAYYQAFVQGILLNDGALITAFSDANFTTGMDFLSFISRDYARSVALPRARVEGTVSLEASVQLPPLVFTKDGLDYWLETWSWNLYEDELQISARTLPTATLTVESETITEAGGTASTGSSAGGASSTPVPQVAPNYFEKDGTFVTGIKLKDEFDAVRVPGLRFGDGVSEPDLYVDTVEDTQGNPVRVLRSPLALITKGDQILEDGEPLSDTGGGGGGTNLTGYISVPDIASLPDPGLPTLGYLVGTNLYVYVGNGGDTLGGKYQNCGPFRGPQGNSGYTGAAGELEVVNNLVDGGATAALSAEQGKVLKRLLDEGYLYRGIAVLTPTPTNPGTPDGKVFYIATEPGVYTNFNDVTVADGDVTIIRWNGTNWLKSTTGASSTYLVKELAGASFPFVGSPDWKYNRAFREVFVSQRLANDISLYRIDRNVSGVWKIYFTTTESGSLYIGSISANSENPYMSGLLNDGTTRVEMIVDWSAIANGTSEIQQYAAPLSAMCYNETYSPGIRAIHDAGGVAALVEILTEKTEVEIAATDEVDGGYINASRVLKQTTTTTKVQLFPVTAGDRLHIVNATIQEATYKSVAFKSGAKPAVNDSFTTALGDVSAPLDTYFDVPSNGWIGCYWRVGRYDSPSVKKIVNTSNVGIKTINGQSVVGVGNLEISAVTRPLAGKNVAILGDSIMQFMGGEVPTNTITLRNADDPTDTTVYQTSQASIVGGLLYLTSSLSGGAVTENSVRLEIVNSAQADMDSRGWAYILNKLGAAEIINVAQGGAKVTEMGVVTPYPCVNGTDELLAGKLVGLPNQARMLVRLVNDEERPAPDAIIIWAGVNGVNDYTTDTLDEAMQIPWETLSDDTLGYTARTKFNGALRYVIESLYRAFPDALIMFFSPVMTSRGNLGINTDNPAKRGYDNLKAVGGALKNIAERFACPFFDALTHIGIANFAYRADTVISGGNEVATGVPLGNLIPRYTYDGLHPSAAGKIVWGNYLCRMLESNYFDKAN